MREMSRSIASAVRLTAALVLLVALMAFILPLPPASAAPSWETERPAMAGAHAMTCQEMCGPLCLAPASHPVPSPALCLLTSFEGLLQPPRLFSPERSVFHPPRRLAVVPT